MSIRQKFDNFKAFVKAVSKNESTIARYDAMSWLQLQAMAYTLLLPNRHNLDEVVKRMQARLDFPDEHLPKFRRYMELFIEYLAGEPESTGFEERLKRYMDSQNNIL